MNENWISGSRSNCAEKANFGNAVAVICDDQDTLSLSLAATP